MYSQPILWQAVAAHISDKNNQEAKAQSQNCADGEDKAWV